MVSKLKLSPKIKEYSWKALKNKECVQEKLDDTSFFIDYIMKWKESDSYMGSINVRKRGNVYEYFFETAKVNNKRKRISKSGFKTKNEAY